MINMAIILNSSIDEDNVQEVLDIVLNKYLESDDLVSSSKKLLKEKYNDKSAKSHLNDLCKNQYYYNYNYYNKDNQGFEWSTLDFS